MESLFLTRSIWKGFKIEVKPRRHYYEREALQIIYWLKIVIYSSALGSRCYLELRKTRSRQWPRGWTILFSRGRSFKGDFKNHNLQACLDMSRNWRMLPEKKKHTMNAQFPRHKKLPNHPPPSPPLSYPLTQNGKDWQLLSNTASWFWKIDKNNNRLLSLQNSSYLGYALGVSWGTQSVLVPCFDQKCSNRISVVAPL